MFLCLTGLREAALHNFFYFWLICYFWCQLYRPVLFFFASLFCGTVWLLFSSNTFKLTVDCWSFLPVAIIVSSVLHHRTANSKLKKPESPSGTLVSRDGESEQSLRGWETQDTSRTYSTPCLVGLPNSGLSTPGSIHHYLINLASMQSTFLELHRIHHIRPSISSKSSCQHLCYPRWIIATLYSSNSLPALWIGLKKPRIMLLILFSIGKNRTPLQTILAASSITILCYWYLQCLIPSYLSNYWRRIDLGRKCDKTIYSCHYQAFCGTFLPY